MVKSLGDGMLVTFASARPALFFVGALQAMLRVTGTSERSIFIQLRTGIHSAEVTVDTVDIYGIAVNLAARLASLAGPDEIIVSASVVDEIVAGLDADVQDLGECHLKHIEHPIRAYRLTIPPAGVGALRSVIESSGPQDAGRRPELPRPRLAVLSHERGEHRLMAALICDEVAVQLSAHSSIDVISRMSTRQLDDVDLSTVLERLNAHYLVSIGCALLEGRVIVSLELTAGTDQRVVRRQSVRSRFDDWVADPAPLLEGPCASIMEAVEASETGRARSMPLASLDSFSLLMGGVRLMHRMSLSDFNRAHDVLEALTARHPRHPDGYAWLAKWHILAVHQGWSTDAARSASMARDLARRALDHDQRCGLALVVSGMVKTFNDRRLDDAELHYQTALDANPSDALAWLLKGMVHAFRGEGEQAIAHTRHASVLSPLDPLRYYFDSLAASAEASAGNYEQAIALGSRSLRANTMHASTLRILTIAYAMLGRLDEARTMAARVLTLEPRFSVSAFLTRSPSADFSIGKQFASALAQAGIPP